MIRYSTGRGRARNVTSFPNLSLSFWTDIKMKKLSSDYSQIKNTSAVWLESYLVEDVWYVLLRAGLLGKAQLRSVFAGK